MARKRKNEFYFRCKDCKEIPEPIKEQSNENWEVIPGKCPKCGGVYEMVFEDEEPRVGDSR